MFSSKRQKSGGAETGYQKLIKYRGALNIRGAGQTYGVLTHPPACVVMRDWTSSSESLTKGSVHLYEHAENGVWMCECQAMHGARIFMDGLPPGQHTTQELQNLPILAKCIHLQARDAMGPALLAAPKLVEHGPIAIVSHFGGTLSLSYAAGRDPYDRVNILTDKHGFYECQAPKCKYTKRKCEHVDGLATYLATHALDDKDPFVSYKAQPKDAMPPRRTSRAVRASISTTPLRYDVYAPRTLDRLTNSVPWPPRCIPPDEGLCATCHACHWGDPVVKEPRATLIGTHTSAIVEVCERPCLSCGEMTPYDGYEDGIFNYSNKTLFLHEVIMNYVDAIAGHGLPYNSYHTMLSNQHERTAHSLCEQSGMCSVSTLIDAMESALGLLDIEYDAWFECPICATMPLRDRIVIGDGKARGFRRDLQKTVPVVERGEDAPAIPGTVFGYINGSTDASKLRGLLRVYAKGGDSTDAERALIISLARKCATKGLLGFLQSIGLRSSATCPATYRQLVYDIATEYPIACLVPRSLGIGAMHLGRGPELERMMASGSLTALDRQKVTAWPSLHMALGGHTCIPQAWHEMLRELVRLAGLPESFHDDAAHVVNLEEGLHNDEAFAYFPNFPRIRKLRTYDARDEETEYTDTCTKHIRKSPTFTPGMFLMTCPHGVALGFKALHTFESVRTPFDILVERFPVAPGMFIYDNACNFSRYALRREPLFFSETKCYIDRAHYPNHNTCHSGYDICALPRDTPVCGGKMTLGQINSQAVEQLNAKLERISQIAFMNQANYVRFVKLFIALNNMKTIKRISSAM